MPTYKYNINNSYTSTNTCTSTKVSTGCGRQATSLNHHRVSCISTIPHSCRTLNSFFCFILYCKHFHASKLMVNLHRGRILTHMSFWYVWETFSKRLPNNTHILKLVYDESTIMYNKTKEICAQDNYIRVNLQLVLYWVYIYNISYFPTISITCTV